ncbi:phosphodiesterase [Marinobacterium lutimaris]|uniref:3',5'-cyclic AMP phosphodiesterase CpdA n=1 Tax=Marinobacterium lutimaris TaxID=568106 RepID=A0A1H6B582_9GAMM|nr:phosphodiesterase [Marinobacterium lutimaris]SEG55780.1 3',5'-cyclic AMP phosphodiesterase CpdA [Marinobacterium lutimaris]
MLIAQLSDLHIKAGGALAYAGKVDTYTALECAVDHLNAMKPRPDLVMVSGDLGDFGTLAEYRQARLALDRLEMPFHVIPGNHDERGAMREGFADHAYLPSGEGHLSYALEDQPLRLVALDTSEPGKPYGLMDSERVQWLESTLSERPEERTLLFMHHPPLAVGITHMDVQCLQEAERLAVVLRRHPQVELILCGHLHRPVEFIWEGRPVYVAPAHNHAVTLDLEPGAASSFTLEPALIRLLYLHPDSGTLLSHMTPVGNCDGPYPFFDAAGRLID